MISRQVDATTHYRRRYLTLPRAITHWYQANEVAEETPPGGSVLEIGPGSGHTTWLLRSWGHSVTTCDFDPGTRPDVVGSVTSLPFADCSFDTVLAAEVLEHLPFGQFDLCLRELARVTRRAAVVTLPAPFVGIAALLNLPRIAPLSFHFGLPYMVKHRFNGEHYWELGKAGYSVGRIKRHIGASGLTLIRSFRPAASLYCYFFIARRSGADYICEDAPPTGKSLIK